MSSWSSWRLGLGLGLGLEVKKFFSKWSWELFRKCVLVLPTHQAILSEARAMAHGLHTPGYLPSGFVASLCLLVLYLALAFCVVDLRLDSLGSCL